MTPSLQEGTPAAKPKVFTGPAWLHVALLLVIAMAITYPYLTHGLPEGHDSGIHIAYQHFFDEQISSGDSYPRWMPGLNRKFHYEGLAQWRSWRSVSSDIG